MQRSIIHGVPYFVDTNNRVFLYEPFTETPTQIGTLNDGLIIPLENIKSTIEQRVASWRAGQIIRKRKPEETEHESSPDSDA